MNLTKFIGIILLLMLVLTSCGETHEIVVAEMSWERSIDIEIYKFVEDESFYSPPDGARNITTKRVRSGYDADGNPRYRRKYFYEIEKWVYERTVSTSGTGKDPYWGETNLADNERESTKSEKYYITGRNQNEEDIKFTLSYEEWCTVDVDQTIFVDVFWGSGNLTTETISD